MRSERNGSQPQQSNNEEDERKRPVNEENNKNRGGLETRVEETRVLELRFDSGL